MVWQVLEMVAAGFDSEEISAEWRGTVPNEAIAEADRLKDQIVETTLVQRVVMEMDRRDRDPWKGSVDDRRRVAENALRRWRSFDRRARMRHPTFEHRVEDLAKGIRDAIEPDRHMVGPIMEDYRYTARVVAEALIAAEEELRNTTWATSL
jgi:hypothetical protein